ncbi:hypothetical protein B296_00016055 [Ensete ventricosum]|uniref:Uncharacterized protein n=1 Tax=Ensete ventricosum TaxID=4639 RepID=A0A427AJG4_ENSVE|nr:hypothetical protein B296_00016055 [Ensete ventricosum]
MELLRGKNPAGCLGVGFLRECKEKRSSSLGKQMAAGRQGRGKLTGYHRWRGGSHAERSGLLEGRLCGVRGRVLVIRGRKRSHLNICCVNEKIRMLGFRHPHKIPVLGQIPDTTTKELLSNAATRFL